MNTKLHPGAYDALAKAEPDEPCFALLGRDAAAPAAITEWARIRRNRAFAKHGDSHKPLDKELFVAELRQAAHAEDIAQQMNDWREAREAGQQVVAGERAAYNEIIRSAEEQAAADRITRQREAVTHFREAAYHVSEAADRLIALGYASARYAEIMAELNSWAETFTATRAGMEAEPDLPLGEAN